MKKSTILALAMVLATGLGAGTARVHVMVDTRSDVTTR